MGGYGIDDRRVTVLRALVARSGDDEIEDLALGESRGMGEGVEGRLPPGRATGLGADRGDGIDQLRLTCGGHPVAVAEGDEQVPTTTASLTE